MGYGSSRHLHLSYRRARAEATMAMSKAEGEVESEKGALAAQPRMPATPKHSSLSLSPTGVPLPGGAGPLSPSKLHSSSIPSGLLSLPPLAVPTQLG